MPAPAEQLAAPPPYPGFLEDWWLAEWQRRLGRPPRDADWADLARDAARLSDAFTTRRAGELAASTADPRRLPAYGLFFFPRNFARVRWALREAPPPAPPARLRLLDLGAGTGAAGLAALEDLARAAPEAAVEWHAQDAADAGLALLQRLFDDLAPRHWPRASLHARTGDLAAPPPGPWDVVLVSYALNETSWFADAARRRAWLAGLVRELAPGGRLVICEPVVRDAPARLEQLRDEVAAGGLARILGPCPHHRPCPLLAAGAGWCHDVRAWAPPPAAVRINRRLFRALHLLKFSLLLLGPPEDAPPETWVRVISPALRHKGRIEFAGCAPDGRQHYYQLLTRGLTAEQRRAAARLERGDRVTVDAPAPLGDGRTLRVRGVRRA